MVTAAKKIKDTCSLEEKLWQTWQHVIKQKHHFADKGPCSQSKGFPLVVYILVSWTIKKAEGQRIDALELQCWSRLLRAPWTARRLIKPKGNQLWVFIGRTDAKAEAPILWPPNENNQLIGKDPDAGKDWRQIEKGVADNEMVGWHYQLHGHEFEQTLGDSEVQGSLVSCHPWGHNQIQLSCRVTTMSTQYLGAH